MAVNTTTNKQNWSFIKCYKIHILLESCDCKKVLILDRKFNNDLYIDSWAPSDDDI
jgi:hypothetical protein